MFGDAFRDIDTMKLVSDDAVPLRAQSTHEFLRQGIHKLAELGSMRSPVVSNAVHMHPRSDRSSTQTKDGELTAIGTENSMYWRLKHDIHLAAINLEIQQKGYMVFVKGARAPLSEYKATRSF